MYCAVSKSIFPSFHILSSPKKATNRTLQRNHNTNTTCRHIHSSSTPSLITSPLLPTVPQTRVDILSESLPFIQRFWGKTIVVKYGGAAMKSPELQASVVNDLVLLSCVGLRPILVHGGGPEINSWLTRLGIVPEFINGLRVTDATTMEVVEMVLVGKVNKSLVSLINCAGATAVGLSGKDARLLTARPAPNAGQLGFVGEITNVDSRILHPLLANGHIPVIASVAADEKGQGYNVNADTAAGEIAAAVGAEKLILLTDVSGILEDMDDPSSLVRETTIKGAKKMEEDGKIAGGMIPKVNCCVRSIEHGIKTASIIDGRVPHSLLLEILTDEGAGTMITGKMGGYGVAVVSTAVGLGIGILLATCVFFCIRVRRKLSQHLPRQPNQSNRPTDSSSGSFSDSSTVGSVIKEMPRHLEHRSWFTRGHHRADNKSKQGIRIFPYKDVQKATANFSTILGQGSFGPVYKATMPDGEVVAVKVLASDSSQGEREFQTEVDLLSRLHHRNLVNLVGYCVDKGQRMLIYEFMSNGSLESHLYGNDLEDPKILSWEQRLQIILDVCHGIDYLHEGAVPPVMHRDLKPANILLDECMRAKVADFGMSKEVVRLHDGQRKSGLKGTYGYMDPHYIASNRFTTKSDVYSFGLIIFELICAINPQQGLENYINLCSMSEDGNAEWEEILDKKLAGNCDPVELGILGDAALKCLHKNPKMRPSVGDIILTVSKIKQRQLAKEGIPNILRRIETLQKEIRSKTMKKDNKGYN